MLIDMPRAARVVAAGVFLWMGAAAARAQQPDAAVLQQRAQDGERALADGRYADAEKAYETLRRMSPRTAEVHARLGLIYFQQGKFTDAIPPLREAIKLKPGLPKVDTLLAMSLSELGRYEEALPALEKGFEQPADPVLRRMAGLHLLRAFTGLGRDLDAVGAALALARLHPDDAEVLYHTGRLFGNFAYLQTMRLSRVAPDSVWMHQAAGEANESQGLHDAAIREYRQVLEIAPRRPGIHFRIGRTLLSRSSQGAPATADASEALQAFERELSLDPTNANAAYEIGELHRKEGRFETARDSFERALKHYPDFEEALVGLGRTLIALEKPALALRPLRAALARNPQNEVAYYQLAQAHGALGQAADQANALAEFKRLRDRPAERAVGEARREVTRQELDTTPPR